MHGNFITFETDSTGYHLTAITEGIRDYFRDYRRSSSYVPLGIPEVYDLKQSHTDVNCAVIGWFWSREPHDYLRARNIPYLNLCESDYPTPLGIQIHFNGEGTAAAEYFIRDIGYRSLGCIGPSGAVGAQRRFREFREAAEMHGLVVDSMIMSGPHHIRPAYCARKYNKKRNRDALLDYLKRIDKPAGIFCGNDHVALGVFHHARFLGISVPDELCILGVGCFEHAADGEVESISVVQLDHRYQGFLAAKAMDEYLTSGRIPAPVRLKPEGILHRQTSIRRATQDSLVSRAVLIMQDDPGLTVESIAQALGVSRQILAMRFRAAYNMSVSRAVDFERFTRAKSLMRNRRYSAEALAGLAGYASRQHMRRSFYRFTRMSPTEYRRRCIDPTGCGSVPNAVHASVV